MMRGAGLWALAAGALALSGCAGDGALEPGKIPPPAAQDAAWSRPLPEWSVLAARYNARIEGVDRLKAAVSLVIEAPDGKGGRRKDQLEGSLLVFPPARVALRLDKVGQTVFQLGSDLTRYWSLDFTEAPVALVGTHARASAHSAKRFGVPVYPLDLIDLLAITPLPVKQGGATMAWAPGRTRIVVTLPPGSRGGASRRLTIDAATAFPVSVELIGAKGERIARAEHSHFVSVDLPGVAVSHAKVAERCEVEIPAEDARVSLGLFDPTNPGSAIRMQAFDLEGLLKAYNVGRVIDIDRGEAP